MNAQKCDICKIEVDRDNHIIVGTAIFRHKDICLSCAEPVLKFLKKNRLFVNEIKEFEKK